MTVRCSGVKNEWLRGRSATRRLGCSVWHASGYIMANMNRRVLILVVLASAVVTWLSGGAGIRTQTGPEPALAGAPGGTTAPDGDFAGESASASSQPAASIPLETPSDDSVQVVYDLIHVTPAPTRSAQQPPRAAPAVRKSAVQRAEASSDRRTDSSRLIARASRVLIGDGRHRPEPFPKPAD